MPLTFLKFQSDETTLDYDVGAAPPSSSPSMWCWSGNEFGLEKNCKQCFFLALICLQNTHLPNSVRKKKIQCMDNVVFVRFLPSGEEKKYIYRIWPMNDCLTSL